MGSKAEIIDGKAFAAKVRKQVAKEVDRIQDLHGLTPGLSVVLVGEDPASKIYVRKKTEHTKEVGMRSSGHVMPADITEVELTTLIRGLNKDPKINGILVQLPLPDHIDSAAVIAEISPDKDVDGFNVLNAGRLATGNAAAMVPCTPLGCLMMLKDRLGDLTGKRALVLGRSNIVGKPMAALLLKENCTVTIAHSKTRDLAKECRRADILVVAVGRERMVKGDWIKPGATVLDVGINRVEVESEEDRKSTRLNSSHIPLSRMPSSA